MQTISRTNAGAMRRRLAIGALAAALLALSGPAHAQQNNEIVFMGPCTGPLTAGSCPIYTSDTRSASLVATRTLTAIVSDVDNFYFDNPYANAQVSVSVTVQGGPAIDLVSLGRPDPGGYGWIYVSSQNPSTTHQLVTTGPAGRYRIQVGPNYLSGPGTIPYQVVVSVTQTVSLPLPLLRANQCRPPLDLGTFTPGGGLANTRIRNFIYVRPGDFDCYEFNVQRSGFTPSALLSVGTTVRFLLTGLPATGTKYLYLYDITAGQFRVLANTTATSLQQYAALPNGRFRVYVIIGTDAATPSQYSFTLNTL